jgi:peroxiredoxin
MREVMRASSGCSLLFSWRGLRTAAPDRGSRIRRHRRVQVVMLGCVLGVLVASWASFGLAVAADVSEQAGEAVAPRVGDAAPDFQLGYATADTIVMVGPSLGRSLHDGPILLAFYPADFSPGCTREVCALRDSFKELGDLHVTVWAISGDNLFAHRAWAQAEKLPFRLLSDPKHAVAREYGTFDPDRGVNRRTVFVVGSDGRIAYVKDPYSVQDDKDFLALKAALRSVK